MTFLSRTESSSGNRLWMFSFRVVLLVLFGYLLASALFHVFHIDEFEAMHTAWYMAQGQDIYVDFFQHHHPGWYLLLVPVIRLLGENIYSVLGARVLTFSLAAIIVLVTWWLAMELKIRKNVALCALAMLLTNSVFASQGIGIRPDVPQVAFGMLSVFFYIRSLNRQDHSWMFLSGLAWGLSLVMLQKAVFLGLGLGLIGVVDFVTGRISRRGILAWLGGCGLILMPFFLFWVYSGWWAEYFFFNWRLNTMFAGEISPARRLLWTYEANPGQSVLVLVGAAACLTNPRNWRIAALVLVLIGSLFFIRTPHPQYLLMAGPLAALVAALGLAWLLGQPVFRQPIDWRVVVPVLFLLVIILVSPAPNWSLFFFFLAFLAAAMGLVGARSRVLFITLVLVAIQGAQSRPPFDVIPDMVREEKPNAQQLEKIEYVLAMTNPSDRVYDGDIQFNLFRPDIDFFWFSLDPFRGAMPICEKFFGYSYRFDEKVRDREPWIVANYRLTSLNKERLEENYIPTEFYSKLFIRNTPRRKAEELPGPWSATDPKEKPSAWFEKGNRAEP